MLTKALFALYFLVLFLYTFLTALNYSRIQAKGWIHPQVVVFLLPFVVNVQLSRSSSWSQNWSSRISTLS